MACSVQHMGLQHLWQVSAARPSGTASRVKQEARRPKVAGVVTRVLIRSRAVVVSLPSNPQMLIIVDNLETLDDANLRG